MPPHPLETHAFGARCSVRTLEKKHATPLDDSHEIKVKIVESDENLRSHLGC